MRILLLALALSASVSADTSSTAPQYVQAVEFPYYLYPRTLWERELVWLKAIGIRTVAFSIPWNWHQPERGVPDVTGRTSPRRDLAGLIRILRRLELHAWVRPLPPVKGWLDGGVPRWAAQDRRVEREWLRTVESLLATQVVKHGGPIAYVEGTTGLDAPAPPGPVVTVSATSSTALETSRKAIATGRGSLLWEDVEDSLYPTGWEQPGNPVYRRGAVSTSGEERTPLTGLRREAALLRQWSALLAGMRTQATEVLDAESRKPDRSVSAAELISNDGTGPTAVSLINGPKAFRGTVRAWFPPAKHKLEIPEVRLGAGEVLWIPVNVPLTGGMCRECSAFAATEHIVYATAELQAIEFENGILAMEFAAPEAAEVLLQLTRQPVGPYLAGGHPTSFDWDETTFRARLPIPEGQGAGKRVRIGLAIEPPETSAFFVNAARLTIGQKNLLATSYSSEELAKRSRLRLPEGFTATPVTKSPTEVEYQVDVPADSLHGDWASLAIEADGVPLGRARLQLFRPASVRLPQATRVRELAVEPALVAVDPRAGRNVDVIIRNNTTAIQNYTVQLACEGLEFLPAKSDISIGPLMERPVSLRVFGEQAASGAHHGKLRITGGAQVEMPVEFVVVPRGRSVAYSADVDGDGYAEWVLEDQRLRAVFSARDGGRWLSFVAKDSGAELLPDSGALAGSGTLEVTASGDALEMKGGGWSRTVRLVDSTLIVAQTTPLPAETLEPGKKNEITLEVRRESPLRALYSLTRQAQ